jgi:hypothetical protein
MIGKPYAGKPHVRFDEGELEIEPSLLRQLSTLPTTLIIFKITYSFRDPFSLFPIYKFRNESNFINNDSNEFVQITCP